jgi:hypothetical protein
LTYNKSGLRNSIFHFEQEEEKMNEPVGTPPAPAPMSEAPRKNNTALIIGIIVAVVLCCCCAAVLIAWNYGDQFLDFLRSQGLY